jgi:hypothetical protein
VVDSHSDRGQGCFGGLVVDREAALGGSGSGRGGDGRGRLRAGRRTTGGLRCEHADFDLSGAARLAAPLLSAYLRRLGARTERT